MRRLALLLATLLAGCPDETPPPPDAPPPGPPPRRVADPQPSVAPTPPLPRIEPSPGKALAVQRDWQAALDAAAGHPETVAARVKAGELADDLAAIDAAGPPLARVALLYRRLPVRQGEQTTTLEKVLRTHLTEHPALDPGALGGDPTRLVALLVLSDPGFLYGQPLLAGGQSVQYALKKGGGGPAERRLADLLLEGVTHARAGRWGEALDPFTQAWVDLARRQGGADALARVEALLAEEAPLEELEPALKAWGATAGAAKR